MSAQRQPQSVLPVSIAFEHVRSAKEIILQQSNAVKNLATQIPTDFTIAVDMIAECRGCVIVTGMGKAGWIGQKISASLASTGAASHFLHPAEAMHGDLGRIRAGDLVLAFSNSGETGEIVRILPSLEAMDVQTIAITASANSTLARHADAVLDYGKVTESGHLGLAPSTSTTLMLALGDALALTASNLKSFQAADFARFHPGGSLGKKLAKVTDVMRPVSQCRVALQTETVRSIYISRASQSRRSGVVLLTDDSGSLTGIFTDSDLAKLLERQKDQLFDQPIETVMTPNPITISTAERTAVAIEMLACHNISELPVTDRNGCPAGLIDITDVVSFST